MRELHPDIAGTAKEMIIKESEGFRLRLEKWKQVVLLVYLLST